MPRLPLRSSLPLFLAPALFASSVAAEPAPYRLGVGASSALTGLPAAAYPVKLRGAGPGRATVVERLLERFEGNPAPITTSGLTGVRTEADHTLAQGPHWLLDVRGDGAWVRYYDESYPEGPENTPLPVEARPSIGELESIALEFIGALVPELVPLGEGEALEAWQSSHQINISEELGGARVEELVASRVVLTRTVNGVPVLGEGSKVVVHVAANRVPFGFTIDFSPYVPTGASQRPLPLAGLRSRGKAIALARSPALAERVEARFECGYYDPGSRAPDVLVTLGLACLSSYRADASQTLGIVDAIPAAEVLVDTAAWPETQVLVGVTTVPDAALVTE